MKLIQTENYFLLIDEEAICKTGELYLSSLKRRVLPKSQGVIQAGDKIVAYYPLTKEAPNLDLPLLPKWKEEVDIKKLAFEAIKEYNQVMENANNHTIGNIQIPDGMTGFELGFKEAQAKQFSLEQLRFIYDTGIHATLGELNHDEEFNRVLQFLDRPQYPKEFIPELHEVSFVVEDNIFKTTTNAAGKQILTGKYIY